MGPWSRWLRRTERLMDARVLALLRILVCAAIVLDLLRVAQLGLVDDFYVLFPDGGINRSPDPSAWIDDRLGPRGGILAYWTTITCLVLAGLGVATRPAMLIGVLAYAQIGHLYDPGDRGVDRLLRTVLVILLFSGAHRRLALGLYALPRLRRDWVPAWPADLVRWVMVMLYLSAGIAKLMVQPGWVGTPKLPVVYRIMTDPMAAHMDPVALEPYWLLWTFFGWATIAVELSSPLLLTRFGRFWSLLAIPMHLGIALCMDLGMFSYGVISLHVLLLYPWLLPLLDRLPALRNRASPPPGAWVEHGRGPEAVPATAPT